MDDEFALEPHIDVELRTRGRERALAALARDNHGVATRAHLAALGFSRTVVGRMISKGQLAVVHRGVYSIGPLRLTQEGRWAAAVLAAGRGAALSHRSAGARWHIFTDSRGVIHVTSPRRRHPRPGICMHFVLLPEDETVIEDGVRVTTPARTIFDLAATEPRQRVGRAMHEADVRRLWDATGLRALMERYPGHRGMLTLQAILSATHLDAPTRNEFEAAFLDFLVDNDLPRPLVNHQVPTAGECDFAWPGRRLIVELDGYETHGTRRQFEKDRARDRALAVAGWRVIRVTWRQLRDEPQKLAADMRALLV